MKFTQKDFYFSIITGLITGFSAWQIFKYLEITQFRDYSFAWFLLVVPVLWIFGVNLGYFLGRWLSFFNQFGKFATIGFTNAAVDFGVLNILIANTDISSGGWYPVFKAISFISAVIPSYFWNKYWAFEGGPSAGSGSLSGGGFEFVDAIKSGVIPQEFIPAAEKGVREALDKGVVAGYPLVDLKVTLYDGTYHEVDSSEIAFKIAAAMALQEATRRAKPVLLEPIMKVEVIIPDKFLGEATGDLNSRRGRIEQMSDRSPLNLKVIDAKVPLSEMFGYATTIRSLSEGRGTYSMEFSHYEEVPANIAQQIAEGKK